MIDRDRGGVGEVIVRVLLFAARSERGAVSVDEPEGRVYDVLSMRIVVLVVVGVKWMVRV